MKYLPDIYQKDIFQIDYKNLKERGIKCLLFDLDNTLALAKSDVVSEEVKQLIKKLKKDFKVIIVSNSPKGRVRKFASLLGVSYCSFSFKPSIRTLLKIKRKYGVVSREIAIIGDQFMTDMIYGFRGKILKILVDPLSDKELKVTGINRYFEKKIIAKYTKAKVFMKGGYYNER